MAGWALLKTKLVEEINQRSEEGCDIEGMPELLQEAGSDPAALQQLYDRLDRLPVRESLNRLEPSDWAGIQQARAGNSPFAPRPMDREAERFEGAWLGRCIGCVLGKPLEIDRFVNGSNGIPGWENIKHWLEGANAWPLDNYVPMQSVAAEEYGLQLVPGSLSVRERIQFVESDDDIRYTVLNLILLEQKGLDWDTWDIGKLWHHHLAYAQVATAETQAYLNFSQVTSHSEGDRPADWEKQLEWVRTYRNPYREWIGARIRVDGYGYAAAGDPDLAAELAWRDASFSHVKNGIYGAMFAAALIAAAFVERDPERLVEIALGQIPHGSRLASDIRQAVAIAGRPGSDEQLLSDIWEAFKHYNWVHTNNNCALVAAALLRGQGDFTRSVALAVAGGWDTDCNGALVGSILGAMCGADGIPHHWKEPIQDTLYAEIHGFHPITISACAHRTRDVYKKLTAGRIT